MVCDERGLRLLFLLPFAPRLDALNGSGRAMAHLLLQLSRRHRIAVIYMRSAEERAIDSRLVAQCAITEEVLRPTVANGPWRQWRHRLRLVAGLFNGRPLWVSDWSVAEFGHRMQALLERWQPHIVQIEYHLMGQYLETLHGCGAPRILVEHEPAQRAAPYLRSLPAGIDRLIHRLDRRAWRRFEQAVIDGVQAVVALTEQDRQALLPLARKTTLVQIPIGTIVAAPLNPLGSRRPNLLFVGNFKHAPNVDAAEWLIETILPQIHSRCPHVTLYIVGAGVPRTLRARANSNVVVTGYVPEVTPYLDQATVVLAPLRLGGGMRVKVIEALAAGKAVVASPLAVEGLDVVAGEQLAVAEDGEAFARATLDLLRDPERRRRLATAAHRWAQSNLSWERSVMAYEALYARLLQETPAGAGAQRARPEVVGRRASR